ncbi:MAG: gamma-glutamyl-gamma-aminobutyrate hydrolase family protein [Prevotellaceae bacterium]|jgi:microsomal dipeptidase-like Zn-dependent dipeptidase/gamma-glutamyl-gamma-aminobutyrate hydrolase PuuD|nr:gamma-glutamyl-gamma-aminobutyrate hydrolase family protein [Prevotellaceae bacterium]
MKPIIGISANYKENNSMLAEKYYQSVMLAGGAPVIVPATNDVAVLEQIVSALDGLIISGGGDIDPKYFDEEPIAELGEVNDFRDEYDIKLIETAAEKQVPILSICRGMQVVNVVFGGSLYQDIAAQHDGFSLKHSQKEGKNITTHQVIIKDNSRLAKIVGAENLMVNSVHHQAVRRVAAGFQEVAFAPDGICEAIESDFYDILGVQWHPEHLTEMYNVECRMNNDEKNQSKIVNRKSKINSHLKIFEWLVERAKIFNRAKKIHKKNLTIDSHCDTPMYFCYENVDIGIDNQEFMIDPKDLGVENEPPQPYRIKVDVPKMQHGLLDAVFMVAYIPQDDFKISKFQNFKIPFEKTDFLLNKIISQVAQHSDIVGIATSENDLIKLKSEGKKAIFLGIENGYGLGENLENIEKFYNLGVRYITLCHNGDNQICDSAAKSQNTHGGLSEFGKKVVQKMNELGIMIDVSHAGESTFWNVINLSKKPIIASHSCARALRNHPRNLTDEQLKALAKNSGVCQVCLYTGFLTDLPVASIETAIEHINYIVQLVGVDFVGIGSDFDGGGEIGGCTSANELINITKALIQHGYSDEEISKILGGNLLRVLNAQN